jgi:hypothetical protein
MFQTAEAVAFNISVFYSGMKDLQQSRSTCASDYLTRDRDTPPRTQHIYLARWPVPSGVSWSLHREVETDRTEIMSTTKRKSQRNRINRNAATSTVFTETTTYQINASSSKREKVSVPISITQCKKTLFLIAST